MKTMTRLILIALLVLPFAACKKAEAPQAAVKAPMSAPTTDDRQAWVDYLNDVVPRNMAGIANQPYVYWLPGEATPDFQDQYDRLLEKAQADVARGIIAGNLLAYGSPASAKMADLVIAAFDGVPADSMKNVRVLFIGQPADNERVKAALAPAGVDYVFIDTSKQ
ncbi:hypothetical protein D0Y53_00445 [Luteimonas weifangensis]|uniref:Secreted protein n=2 Tax=Cognatiluteimonas weifangensis TaxID=2303539 RepID=A0A372DS19_9GAMM|nr:hypothetical protein D0Y53_00445 [Luteimonas weifangensis]